MKIHFPKTVLLFVFATMLLAACGGNDKKEDPDPDPKPDTEKPVISTILPANPGQYPLGGAFLYKGTFTDNVELKQVVFSLADNKPVTSTSLKGTTGVGDDPWDAIDSPVTVLLSGKSQTLDQGLFGVIPNDIWTGIYTLTITCTDKTGNIASETIDVTIQ